MGEARGAGFDNISLDLMMWLPQQTREDWQESVEALIDVGPEHASLYLLELYPNAPLKEEMARSGWSLAPDDDAAEMYLWSLERLDAAGYRQYEISNVARPGRESRHNLKYWQDGEWLGVRLRRPLDDRRRPLANVAATEDYIRRVGDGQSAVSERAAPDADGAARGGAVHRACGWPAGLDIDGVGRRYGVDVWERFGAAPRPVRRRAACSCATARGSA